METLLGKNIAHAADLLRQGEVVAIPTETVYGLAGNATSEAAIRKIFETKQRPLHNPLILHIASAPLLQNFCMDIPELAWILAEHFWPGPLTMLLKKKSGVLPDVLNNSLPEVAVRVPDHALTLALLEQLEFPLAAPSANPFGYISPTTPEHVLKQLGGKIPYVLDGGTCTQGIESTIVRFVEDEVVVLRQGAIPAEVIREVVENVRFQPKTEGAVLAPGMLASHYAPRTKLILVEDIAAHLKTLPNGNYGALTFSKKIESLPDSSQIVLSAQADLKMAASKLYSALHELDALGFDLILAERFPNEGLGAAINDRLTRASA